jgi:hypothetical protein
MGNIITQATNNATSYGVDDKGNLSMNANSTFTAQTGIFNKGVQFNGDIDAKGSATFTKGVTFNDNITAKLINNVDIGALNTSVSRLSTGVGAGEFTGSVSAKSFTGSIGTFDSVNSKSFTGTTGTFSGISAKTGSFDGIIASKFTGAEGNFDNVVVNTIGLGSKTLSIIGGTGSNINFGIGSKINAETGSFTNIYSGGSFTGNNGYFTNKITSDMDIESKNTIKGNIGSFGTLNTTGLITSNGGLTLNSGNLDMKTGTFLGKSGTFDYLKSTTSEITNLSVISSITGNNGYFTNGLTSSTLNLLGNLNSTGGVNYLSNIQIPNGTTGIGHSLDLNGLKLNGGRGIDINSPSGSDGIINATGTNGYFKSVNTNILNMTGTGIINATGTNGYFNLISVNNLTSSGLSLKPGTNVNMTGTNLYAGTGVFANLVSSGLSLSGGTGTVNMTGYSLSAGTGIFGSLLTTGSFNANGGVSLPTSSIFTLAGNMTGTGNINVGNAILSGSLSAQSTNVTSLTSNNMISANGGIQIGTSANKWQIKESNGGTATGLLCFARGGSTTPYACIDTSGNLIAGTGYTVAP